MAQKLIGIGKPGEKDIAQSTPGAQQQSRKNNQQPPVPSKTPPPATQTGKEEATTEAENAYPVEAEEKLHLIRPELWPHAFVVMPSGRKKGGDRKGQVKAEGEIIFTKPIPAGQSAGIMILLTFSFGNGQTSPFTPLAR